LSEQRWATDFVETTAERAANNSLHNARTKLKKLAIVSMAKKFLRRCIGAHTLVHVHFFAESKTCI